MKNIVRFLSHSKLAILAIVVLLIGQAYCDLALPGYTSDLLNVGLQSSGIEDAVPKEIRVESIESLKLLMSDEDAKFLEDSYEKEQGGSRKLKKGVDREKLNDILLVPECMLFQMQSAAEANSTNAEVNSANEADSASATAKENSANEADSASATAKENSANEEAANAEVNSANKADSTNANATAEATNNNPSVNQSYTIEQVKAAIESGLMTKEQFIKSIEEGKKQLEKLSDTYLSQVAVYYVKAEYEALDIDLDAIRNHYLFVVGAKMLAMSLFMTVTAILTGLIASVVSARIGKKLRQALYEKVMKFTNAEMEDFSTASLITRATNDIQQIQIVTVLLLRMVSYAPILAIGGIIKVASTHSGMSWIIVLAVIVLCSCVGILVGVCMPKFRKMQELVDRLNLVARELLGGIMPIRAFGREQHEEKRFEVANTNLFETQLFTNRAMSLMAPFMMFIMNGISVLIVWVGAHKVEDGVIQIGDLTAFITYSMVIVMGFLLISMVAIFLPRAGIAADRIAEVIDKEVVLKDPESPQDKNFENIKGVLKFDNVNFRYPGAEEMALNNISFEAKPGKTTAIIGSTGCGKTTLLNLIPRFYDVTEGAITIDGVDIRNVSQHKLREQLGYVPQKGMLFSGTIESNIKYAGEDITDEAMKEAASIAQAVDFIESKDDKYDSSIAQEGSNVSGGQRQRLSIARAIAKNPKIFLFDDSFSALDYKTDLALRKALAEKIAQATVIIVAQRISTILHADQIIVLEDGAIVGMGTHEQLLADCATYQEIAKSQLSEKELNDAVKGGKQ